MPISISFDKPAYYTGEIATVTISGANPLELYTIALKNSSTGDLLVIQTVQAPSGTAPISFTTSLRITQYFLSVYYDRVVVMSATETAEVTKPSILPSPTTTYERIEIDKTTYAYGEYIRWKASNLISGKTYIVGVTQGGLLYYVESRDKWTATESTKTGSYYVGTNLQLGNAIFSLYEYTNGILNLLDYKDITIVKAPTAPPPQPPPVENWWQKVMEFVKSPLGIALIVLAAVFLFFRK